ncbi:tetratricopeptide repeat protein [Ferruginibacter sp. SUN106]|uniref:tetratricopeptide repeat protein n=1 Tax=Ferruginibacter sp. SUN106 TaxID=2978348 RepID=UPI003D36D485
MQRIFIVIFFLLLQYSSFSQSRAVDSLNALLNKAKEDTVKLNIYNALIDACEAKDNLLYAEPGLDIANKLLVKANNEKERQALLLKEQQLLSSIPLYYNYNDTTDWKKVFAYIDNRLKAIEKTGNQKRTAEFLFQMAYVSLDLKKDSTLFFATIQKSTDLFTKIKDSSFIVYSYGYVFAFSKSAGNYAKAFEAVQSIITLSKQLSYSKGVASGLLKLADLYRDFGEYSQAKENYQAALDIVQQSKDTGEIFNVLAALGGFYYKQHNTAKALEYYNHLFEIYKQQTDPEHNIGSVYKWMGMTYNDAGDYANALQNFEKSRFAFKAAGDIYETANVLNETGSMYNKQKDFEKALAYHERSVKIADSLKWYTAKPEWLYLVALDHYGLKNYDKAKEINDVALVTFKKFWYDTKITSKMELLALQIDSARGDWHSAFGHYKEYTSLNDILKGNEVKKEAQKEKFQTEIDKQKLEQEKKDAVAMRTRNLQYIAIGAFLLLGIFLFFGYQSKNKDKRRIEKAYAELKSTQAQLIQSEKMASLGELTAGIAHEIQNPLNFVNNFSEVSNELIDEMNDELNKGDIEEAKAISADIKQNLEKINHHGKRADAIVKGMLQHSQSSSGKKEPTDINKLADEYLRLAYHGLRAKDKSFNATLKTDFDESIGNINIIPQDMGRVLLNLITNAFYAVQEKSSLKDLTSLYKPAVSINTKRAGDKVLISVTDNGNGIPQNIFDKIFQPFFTTKPTGQGTGLGLSLAYDIVKAHGGELKVETKENEGTTFIIQLPTNYE